MPNDPLPDAPSPSPSPSPRFAALAADGALVVADGASGAVLERAVPPAPIVDLAWDPWADRLIAVEADPEGEGGELCAYPLPLGVGEHVAWLDGRARVLPAPPGIVVFEQSYGERWRLLGAAPTSSLPAPPPSAAWMGPGPSLFAVTEGALREVPISATGFGAPATTPLPGGVVVVAARDGGALAVEVPLPAPGMRAVAAAAVGELVAVLAASPATLVVAALSADRTVTATAHLPLPGEVADPAPFFSRDLCGLGDDLVLAATSAGVFAARIGMGPEGIRLEPAPGFDGSALRGPLAPSP